MKKSLIIIIALCGFSAFAQAQTPGGISSQLLGWWKADTGVTGTTDVTGWQDNSPQGNNLTSANGPTLIDSDLNYHPSLNFNGINENLFKSDGILGTSTNTDIHVTFINKTNTIKNSTVFYEGMADGKRFLVHAPWANRNVYFDYGTCCTTSRINTHWGTETGVYNLWTFGSSTGTSTPTGTRKAIHRNGQEIATNDRNDSGAGQNGAFTIGGQGNSTFHDGNIPEFIVWNSTPTAIDLQKVHSYLAIKYSLALGTNNNNDGVALESPNADGINEGDYLNTNGDVVWDASVSPEYHKAIIGLARDDSQALMQKQSRTQNDSSRIYLNQLMGSNALNTGTFSSDLQYLVMGNNQDSINTSASANLESPTEIEGRIAREWKVTNTNFAATFNMQIKLDNCIDCENAGVANFRLLVDTDGNFSDATVLGTESGLTFTINAGVVTIEGISTSIISENSTAFITLGYVPVPLPIELLSFDATAQDKYSVLLEWITEVEINNDFFTVERSKDGMNWEGIERVMGAGNSNYRIAYETFDNDPLTGVSYYRLKQTDYDGEYTYSKVVQVNIESEERIPLAIFPNPASTHLTIEADPAELEDLRVFDMLGREVSAMITFTQTNDSRVTAELSRLNSGNYMLVMKNGTHLITKH